MRLDTASVLLQWATGGLVYAWVTTRRRVVGPGYGWLLRATFGFLAAGALVAGVLAEDAGAGATLRDVGAGGVTVLAFTTLGISVVRRREPSAMRAERARRAARVAQMAGAAPAATADATRAGSQRSEYDPRLDLLAPLVGGAGLLGAAAAVGGPFALSAWRTLAGALLLGAVTDAMLLGHWYLVQPGLARDPIKELVVWCAVVWPLDVAAWLWPTGMGAVLDGSIDDGWGGLLGWTWLVCALTTIALVVVTWLALRERAYSAVMAATGLLYLAILTAFGTDVLARAVLAP